MPDKDGMSIEEILAAARAEKGIGGDSDAPQDDAPQDDAPQDDAPQDDAPQDAEAAPAPAKPPGEMSVADIMAAARGGKAAPKAAAAPKKSAKASKSPAKAEAKPKPSAAQETSGPRDTSSVLAMARKQVKPGPISKAEAAAQGKPLPTGGGKPKLDVPPMPKRPDFAAKAAPAEARRGFLGSLAAVCFGSALAIGFSTFSLTNLLWVLGLARFMFPNILTEPPTRFKVGFPDGFSPGQVETKFKAQFGVWIVRAEYDGQTQIYALQSVCTHLGCTPNWLEAEQKFKCPCHGSGFYKDGVNFEGPAPRPLERFAIKLADDGQLEVDKSQKFQEELGQWRDAASFVPVV